MLELYQFELSHYSEKVRLILDYKGLEYRKIEVTPGVGQMELYRLSGQIQVPVLKDGDMVVADSTEIALYLERKYPDPPLIPADPYQRGLCLLMEEWADESLGLKGRKVFLGAFNQNQNFRKTLLPASTPDLVKSLVGAVPSELLEFLGTGVGLGKDDIRFATTGIKQDLEALCLILQDRPYLVGDRPTLADLAVAGLSIILKFPDLRYLDVPASMLGKGVPGIADDSFFSVFFNWRDRLYAEYRQPLGTPLPTTDVPPTSIEIE
ncbi:MAG: glutathione S-transferase family protein [Chloroflexaceae bacterium]|nr:glutathione S-transferase family protein [Chloroflexaceae bacterium]